MCRRAEAGEPCSRLHGGRLPICTQCAARLLPLQNPKSPRSEMHLAPGVGIGASDAATPEPTSQAGGRALWGLTQRSMLLGTWPWHALPQEGLECPVPASSSPRHLVVAPKLRKGSFGSWTPCRTYWPPLGARTIMGSDFQVPPREVWPQGYTGSSSLPESLRGPRSFQTGPLVCLWAVPGLSVCPNRSLGSFRAPVFAACR